MKFGSDQYDSATEGTKKAETAEERGRREAERPIDCDLCDGEQAEEGKPYKEVPF